MEKICRMEAKDIVFDGAAWGERMDGKVIIRMEWLDDSYVPRERSFPSFMKLYK